MRPVFKFLFCLFGGLEFVDGTTSTYLNLKIIPQDSAIGAYFGSDVNMYENLAVIGAYGNSTANKNGAIKSQNKYLIPH
jgi:hypothetical protein